MNYLIDTNIISELRKGTRCNSNVARWYAGADGDGLYLSVLVLGEIRKGIESVRARDITQARALEKWLDALGQGYEDRILSIDRATAEMWGEMSAVRPLPVIDGLLAATAKLHGMTLVTRNAADVAGLGAQVLNPF